MPSPPVSHDTLRETLRVFREHDENQTQTAHALEISRGALQNRLRLIEREGILPDPVSPLAVRLPDFGEDDVPVEEIIAGMDRRYQKRYEHRAKKEWFPVTLPDDLPIGLAFVGDPHLDDDGCNWPLLREHVALLKTPGVHAINIGDSHNNWAGRLAALYANQESSKKTAYKLVRWFMHDSGIDWLLWLLGNHDLWSDGAAVLHEMARDTMPVFDWQAKFVLTFPGGFECPVWAAHSFKGTSIYNPVHGAMRAAKFGQKCPRLLVQGHHHEFSSFHGIYEDLDLDFWAVKARGYKFIDSYADLHQFGSNSYGATVLAIVEPKTGKVRVYDDLADGIAALRLARAAGGCRLSIRGIKEAAA